MADKESTIKPPEPQDKKKDKKQEKKSGVLSGILAVLFALIVVAVVFCGVFYVVLKNNIFGLGEAYRPMLQSHPILKLALPPVPPEYDPDDPKNLDDKQIREKYMEYRAKVADLTSRLEEAEGRIAEMEKEAGEADSTQKILEENQKVLEETEQVRNEIKALKAELTALLAKGDTEGFKNYFSQMDAEAARAVYAELAKADLDSEAKAAVAKPFTIMEPASAARVLTELWSKDRNIMISIMESLKAQTSALILEEMDASVAAEVMRALADRKLGRQ